MNPDPVRPVLPARALPAADELPGRIAVCLVLQTITSVSVLDPEASLLFSSDTSGQYDDVIGFITHWPVCALTWMPFTAVPVSSVVHDPEMMNTVPLTLIP